MAKDNGLESVESSMIWESQYDAMMIWMQKTGTTIGTEYGKAKKNTETTTGKSTTDIINKVYDLYGCHYEWTLESNSDNRRVLRGGRHNGGNAPSFRAINYYPVHANDDLGSRLSLYIKQNWMFRTIQMIN